MDKDRVANELEERGIARDVDVIVMGDRVAIDFQLNHRRSRDTNSSIIITDTGELVQFELRFPPLDSESRFITAQRDLVDFLDRMGAPESVYSFIRPKSLNPHIRYEASSEDNPITTEEALELIDNLFNEIKQNGVSSTLS